MIETTRHLLTRNMTRVAQSRAMPLRDTVSEIARCAGVSASDLTDIMEGKNLPTAKDAESLFSIEHALDLQPFALACRTSGIVAPAPLNKAEDGENRPMLYRFVMSTNDVDRARDVVDQTWDLRDFMSNPVGLFNHKSWEPAVGLWQDLTVETDASGKSRLIGYFQPVPLPEVRDSLVVAAQLQAGVLRACSVGFLPGEWKPRTGLPENHPLYSRAGGYVLGSTDAPNRLMECSICTIPMNGSAVLLDKVPQKGHTESTEPQTLVQALARHWVQGSNVHPDTQSPPPETFLAAFARMYREAK